MVTTVHETMEPGRITTWNRMSAADEEEGDAGEVEIFFLMQI